LAEKRRSGLSSSSAAKILKKASGWQGLKLDAFAPKWILEGHPLFHYA
jgi:hypothetical protein